MGCSSLPLKLDSSSRVYFFLFLFFLLFFLGGFHEYNPFYVFS
uniref:Uncharacterized protein n=1 Tax=Rhizophora mucronata TaxID=61149 RepID=A0A2P2NXD4_RHIMU